MNRLKRGDAIEWTFGDGHGELSGKTFREPIAAVLDNEKICGHGMTGYGVYCEYGQDIIGFDDEFKVIKQ